MPSTIDAFTQDVHCCFTKLFQKLVGPPDSRYLLAFLPLGSAVSPQQFKLHPSDATYDSAVAAEQCSDLADVLPWVDSAVYKRSLAHLSDQYALLLNAAPVEGVDDSAFANIKADAHKLFSTTLGSMDQNNPFAHHPAFATPKDWFDPSNQANWSNYSFSPSEQSATPTKEIPRSGPTMDPPPRNWAWQVLPQHLSPSAETPPNLHPPVLPTMATGLRRPVAMMSLALVQPVHNAALARTPATSLAGLLRQSSTQAPAASIAAQPILQASATVGNSLAHLSAQAERVSVLAGITQQQHVEANSLTVDFQYSMVQIDRPWMSSAFLENRNWYLPGYQAGSVASGAFDSTFSSPADAPLSALPIAFIMVKGLKIKGNWQSSDLEALNQAAGLGPFSMLERTPSTTGTDIECDGMQIVAWFCQAMPILPPQSDPAIPT